MAPGFNNLPTTLTYPPYPTFYYANWATNTMGWVDPNSTMPFQMWGNWQPYPEPQPELRLIKTNLLERARLALLATRCPPRPVAATTQAGTTVGISGPVRASRRTPARMTAVTFRRQSGRRPL